MDIGWQMLGLAQEYRLFNGKQVVGLLKNNFLSGDAYGEFRGFMMRFDSRGGGKKQSRILDIEGEKVLGTVEYSYYPRAATIRYEGQAYEWKYLGTRSRRSWTLTDGQEHTRYETRAILGTTGTILEGYLPPVVLLTGLYVHGYFFKKSLINIVLGFVVGLVVGYGASGL